MQKYESVIVKPKIIQYLMYAQGFWNHEWDLLKGGVFGWN